MAVITKIIITFNPLIDVELNDILYINISNVATQFSLNEVFKTVRTAPSQVTTATTGVLSDVNAKNLNDAVNLDGGYFGLNAIYLANEVILTLSNETYYFEGLTGTLLTDGKITYTTELSNPVTEKTLNITSYTTGSPNICEDINVVLDATGGSELYNVYVDNILTISNTTSPITVPLKRGVFNTLRVTDNLGVSIGSITSNNPRKIISSGINTSITNTSSGSNLNINVEYISPFMYPYNYSLDGINYITENIFTSLTNGNYTIYVRDAFGCITTKNIIVDGVTTVTETIFSISEINPIRYSKYEPNAKKNYQNTLSCNSLRLVKHPYIQEFLVTDTITTQFKTNAQYINVFALAEDLTALSLSAVKRTENIGLSAKSTSTFFDIGDGRSAIYFGAVNLLDPVTSAIIGNADYGFTLPIWANKAGDFVTIDGLGEVQIDSIGYSDTYSSFILEFNFVYSGVGTNEPRNISANYNLQPYEIYEFTAPMASLPESYNIVIETGISANEIEFTYVSEKIQRVEDKEFLFEIDYWDDANIGDMVYQTGIKHKLRLNGYVDYLGEQSTSGFDGDKKRYVTDNTVYNSEKFTFNRLSFQMAQKLRLVVAHSNLLINGIYYDISEEPEVSGNENYNLKLFSVTLKPNGDLLLENVSESIVGTSESLEIAAGITAIQGKALLLWTQNNG